MSVEPASDALDRVVQVLNRIVPVAAAIRRGTLRFALAGAVGGAVIVYASLRDGAPEATRGWLAGVVVVALAAAVIVLALLPDMPGGQTPDGAAWDTA